METSAVHKKKNASHFDIAVKKKIGPDMLMHRIVKEAESCMILPEWLLKMSSSESDVRDKDWESGKKTTKA